MCVIVGWLVCRFGREGCEVQSSTWDCTRLCVDKYVLLSG